MGALRRSARALRALRARRQQATCAERMLRQVRVIRDHLPVAAMHSTSTRAPSARPLAAIALRAGRWALK